MYKPGDLVFETKQSAELWNNSAHIRSIGIIIGRNVIFPQNYFVYMINCANSPEWCSIYFKKASLNETI